MSKRRLTRQQRERIDRRQREHVAAEHEVPLSTGPRINGLVTCHFGQQLDVEALDGERPGRVFRCFQRSNLPPLVCGDRVVFQATGERSGVVVAAGARHSVLARPSSGGELKAGAANIDLVLIVIAPVPQPFMSLVDRYLVAIESLALKPVLVVNKSDLLSGAVGEELHGFETLYGGIGYPVLRVSATDGSGLEELKHLLRGKTAVMLGQSGVGKSSLLNALGQQPMTEVGDLSAGAAKGTHTTTAARLFHLAGFDLIDSPGIREFALWHVTPGQLIEGFVEFRPFLGRCRFRDCSHRTEPECALREALARGEISAQRLDSYFHILESLASL